MPIMFQASTKREMVGISLLFLAGIFSFLMWNTFSAVIDTTAEASSMMWPFLWLIFLSAFFFLGSIVWKNVYLRVAGTLLVIVPSLLFIAGWEHRAVSVLVFFFLYHGSTSIFLEGKERTRFHFFKYVRSGSTLFFLGIALLFSSGYYASLKDSAWEELVPRFRVSQEMTKGIFKVAGVVNPSFAQLTEGDATVDEFLLNLEQNKQKSELTSPVQITLPEKAPSLSPEMRQLLEQKMIEAPLDISLSAIEKQLFLENGRAQIASFVGRPVDGSERISDVLSLVVQNKITTFLSGEKTTQHIPSQAIPFFIVLLLFLTLISFASILAPLCILFAQLIFWLMVKAGLLVFETVMVEQQRLQE